MSGGDPSKTEGSNAGLNPKYAASGNWAADDFNL
jgi:hypothetical protein